MSSDQTTLEAFSHPKENSPSPKDQVKNEPEIKKSDPKDQDQKVELKTEGPTKDDLPHSQILDQIGKNKIEAYDKEYLVDISEEELKEKLLEYIEENKPVYFDELMDKFSNTKDPIILRVLGSLHEKGKLHGYRKEGESLLTPKKLKTDSMGNIIKNKPSENITDEESYLEEPEPEKKPETTKDKDPDEVELSRDEEKLISIIRGLHRKLAKKDRSWITYKSIYDNKPKNWITLRLDRTLTELIKNGVLEVKGLASKEYRLNIKRLKDIQAINDKENS